MSELPDITRRYAMDLLSEVKRTEKPGQVTQRPKYWRVGFLLVYLEYCDDLLFEDPPRALEWAKVAPFLASFVEFDDEGRRNDLRARSYAVHGGALRLAGDFQQADHAFRRALEFSKRSAERAGVQRRLALLRIQQGATAEAVDLATHAVEQLRKGEGLAADQELAKALVNRGISLFMNGAPSDSLQDFAEALVRADPTESPRTFFSALHNLAAALALESGTPEAVVSASSFVRAARRQVREKRNSPLKLKLIWCEATLNAKMGADRWAEKAFKRARRGLKRVGSPWDVCLLSLDLGAFYQKHQQWPELLALAREVLELASAGGFDEEVVAALRLWKEAAEGQAGETTKRFLAARRLVDSRARTGSPLLTSC